MDLKSSPEYISHANALLDLLGLDKRITEESSLVATLKSIGRSENQAAAEAAVRAKLAYSSIDRRPPLGAIEAHLDKLGREYDIKPSSKMPWLPVAFCGPVLVLAHFNPNAEGVPGLPLGSYIKCVVSWSTYDKISEKILPLLEGSTGYEKLPSYIPSGLSKAKTLRELDRLSLSDPSFSLPADRSKIDEMCESPQISIPLEALSDTSVNTLPGSLIMPNPDAMDSIPKVFRKTAKVLCYANHGPNFFVATVPNNQTRVTLNGIKNRIVISGARPKVIPLYVSDQAFEEISSALDKNEKLTVESSSKDRLAISSSKNVFQANVVESPQNVDTDNPAELLSYVLTRALKASSSDIHVNTHNDEMLFRIRVHGSLEDVARLPASHHEKFISFVKSSSETAMDIAEKRLPQDGRMVATCGNREVELRISTLPNSKGESLVLRILDKKNSVKRVEDLHQPEDIEKRIRTAAAHSFGLSLFTGPTGSGKTSTLAAILNEVNTPDKALITMEDPIELDLDGAVQVPVDVKKGLTFDKILRSALRQDPDIIMIGEIRDKETADLAVRSALTGHSVFSTIHTNDAISAVNRLLDFGIEKAYISDALRLLQAQRLVKTLCNCKESRKASDREKARVRKAIETLDPSTNEPTLMIFENFLSKDSMVFNPNGCPRCSERGYNGRRAIMETAYVTPDLAAAIFESASRKSVLDAALKGGYRPLYYEALKLFCQGIVPFEQALANSSEVGP